MYMENSTIPQQMIRSFEKFRNNYNLLNENFELLKKNEGKYVAIGNGKILGFSDSRESLVKKYGSIEGIYIDLITPSNILWIL